MVSCSVIIPAYNEEQRLARTLADYAAEFASDEVIVVLNGCQDNTPAVASAVAAAHRNVRIVEIKEAVGKGGAIRAGLLVALAPTIAYTDADGSTPARELRRLANGLGDADGVIGSRWLPDSKVRVAQPFTRRVASRGFNTIVRVLFGLRYSDTQCGAKVFRSSALRRVIDSVETANFAFDVDVLFALKRRRVVVKEVATQWADASDSKVKLVPASIGMLLALLRLRLLHSPLRYVLPLYDKLLPTRAFQTRGNLSILVIDRAMTPDLFEAASAWARSGHDVTWIAPEASGEPAVERRGGVRICRVGPGWIFSVACGLFYVTRLRNRFDIVVQPETERTPSQLFSLKPKMYLNGVREPEAVVRDMLKVLAARGVAFVRSGGVWEIWKPAQEPYAFSDAVREAEAHK